MLLIKGTLHEKILNTFDKAFVRIQEWCEEHKLELAKHKTAIMPMFCRKLQLYRSHPAVKNNELKIVSQLPYLGVILDSKLTWNAHITHLNHKTHRVLQNLVRCSKSTWGLSYNHLIVIHKYCLQPIIT